MPLKPGDAFFLRGTGGFSNPGGAHLCVCLTGECPKGNLLVVPVVTYRPGFDTSCMIGVGDHEFIKHSSCVSYGQAKLVYGKAVERDIEGSVYDLAERIDPLILKKMRHGVFSSGDIPEFALKFAKAQGLVPPPKKPLGDGEG